MRETGNKPLSLSQSISTAPIDGEGYAFIALTTVMYEEAGVGEEEEPRPNFPDMPDVPMVDTTMVVEGKKSQSVCMAGVFGVPVGWRLHPEDPEPAPLPLLSPDFKLSSIPDGWFKRGGNTNG